MDTSFFWNIISRELESDELSSRQVKNWMERASYTANSLNQYSSRDVPAYLNLLGIANANASVTVNQSLSGERCCILEECNRL